MLDGDATGFARMLELQVTPLLSDPDPAVGLQSAQDLPAIHGRMIHRSRSAIFNSRRRIRKLL